MFFRAKQKRHSTCPKTIWGEPIVSKKLSLYQFLDSEWLFEKINWHHSQNCFIDVQKKNSGKSFWKLYSVKSVFPHSAENSHSQWNFLAWLSKVHSTTPEKRFQHCCSLMKSYSSLLSFRLEQKNSNVCQRFSAWSPTLNPQCPEETLRKRFFSQKKYVSVLRLWKDF